MMSITQARIMPKIQSSVRCTGLGFPNIMIGKLKFQNQINLQQADAAIPQFIEVCLNDPYNPAGQPTPPADQPNWFDYFCAVKLYRRFTCYKVQYEVYIQNKFQKTCMVGIGVSNPNSTSGTWAPTTSDQMSKDGEQYNRAVRPLREAGNANGSVTVFKGTQHVSKMFGITKDKLYDDPDYSGSSGASPAKLILLSIGVAEDAATASPEIQQVYIQTNIIYHCKFWSLDNDAGED